ncbi:MAG: hypothetical protein K1000chlam2_00201 [Chlamydiae bacterium]|nr:hypothetical protein [Chlamydiota bacterium]
MFNFNKTPTPPPVVELPPVEKPPIYTVDKNTGWRTYDVDQLNKEQCTVVKTICQDDASSQRIHAIALVIGGILAAGGIAYSAFLIAQVATPIVLGFLGNMAHLSGVHLHPAVRFAASCVTHVASYALGAIGIKRLWPVAVKEVSSHWTYAKHLDQQANDARLFKEKTE